MGQFTLQPDERRAWRLVVVALSELDRGLLQSCLERKPRAWENFVDRFLGLVVHVVNHSALCRSIRITAEDRDDLVAEVFLTIVNNDFAVLRRFSGSQQPGHLLDGHCPPRGRARTVEAKDASQSQRGCGERREHGEPRPRRRKSGSAIASRSSNFCVACRVPRPRSFACTTWKGRATARSVPPWDFPRTASAPRSAGPAPSYDRQGSTPPGIEIAGSPELRPESDVSRVALPSPQVR